MKNEFQGIDLSPYWRVLHPAVEPQAREQHHGVPLIRIRPGMGFGNGTHPTTQLCLLALGYLLRNGFQPEGVLDFGAGSGILAIAVALSGAEVEAVEIDPPAVVHARENTKINGVQAQVAFHTSLSEPARQHDLVMANILNDVLLEYSEMLCERLSPNGHLILSGLVATDVPAILARYKPLLAPMRARVYERGEWRAVVFSG